MNFENSSSLLEEKSKTRISERSSLFFKAARKSLNFNVLRVLFSKNTAFIRSKSPNWYFCSIFRMKLFRASKLQPDAGSIFSSTRIMINCSYSMQTLDCKGFP